MTNHECSLGPILLAPRSVILIWIASTRPLSTSRALQMPRFTTVLVEKSLSMILDH